MDPFKFIYQHQAAAYQQMILAEDADGNLLAAVKRIMPVAGQTILDLGAGTGRIAALLAHTAKVVIGLDLQRAMLVENQRAQAVEYGISPLIQADMHRLPVLDKSIDCTTAGWSIGHLCGWHPSDWQTHVQQVLSEMERVTKTGGSLLIFETMGTGTAHAAPPNQELARYYRHLVENWGFQQQVISTDYQFSSTWEAAAMTEFFFGPELAETIRHNHWARVPEWTGVWSRQIV